MSKATKQIPQNRPGQPNPLYRPCHFLSNGEKQHRWCPKNKRGRTEGE